MQRRGWLGRTTCSWNRLLPEGMPMLYAPLGPSKPSRVPCPPERMTAAADPALSACMPRREYSSLAPASSEAQRCEGAGSSSSSAEGAAAALLCAALSACSTSARSRRSSWASTGCAGSSLSAGSSASSCVCPAASSRSCRVAPRGFFAADSTDMGGSLWIRMCDAVTNLAARKISLTKPVTVTVCSNGFKIQVLQNIQYFL